MLACCVEVSFAAPNTSGLKIVSVADNTSQSFASFGSMPSINNDGAVAFIATGGDFGQGVFRLQSGLLTTIAARSGKVLSNFGDDVVVNAGGVVAFDASLHNTGERAILTSDGIVVKTIVDSIQQGIVGGPFLSIGAMNAAGTVVFHGSRTNSRSQAIFAGDGGPLSTIVDTTTSNFQSLGNAAINNRGEVVFRAFRNDGSEAIFAGRGGATLIADTSGAFTDFLDPVMNNSGLVAEAGFLSNGGIEIFTGEGGSVTPRTNPGSNAFTFVDNVTVNDAGTIAFFADKTDGGQGIFLLSKTNDKPLSLIQTGDPLFGSTVTSLSLGRFSLNDHDQVVFVYTLQSGRSGIAIVSRNTDD